jgi:surfeit locus 1 family protein
MSQVSFWKVARRPKWIGGLAIALLVAVIFSLLMQWQLSRTFSKVGLENLDQSAVELASLAEPGMPLTSAVYDRLVTVDAELENRNLFIVQDRLQLTGDQSRTGYWLIGRGITKDASITLALGFSEELASVSLAKALLESEPNVDLKLKGLFEPTEPVKPTATELLGSVSLAQLVNLYEADALPSYPGYVIVQDGFEVSGLENISIGLLQQRTQVNWLTAFYAIEWAFFALAAFYLWGRMVMDERNRELGL